MKKLTHYMSLFLAMCLLVFLQSNAVGISSEIENDSDLYFEFIYTLDEGYEWLREALGNSKDFVADHAYVKNTQTGEIRELISEPVRQMVRDGLDLYCVTKDGMRILKTDCYGGTPVNLYTASNGAIDYLNILERNLYFVEGEVAIRFGLDDQQVDNIFGCPGAIFFYPVSETEFGWCPNAEITYLYNSVTKEMREVLYDDLFPSDDVIDIPFANGGSPLQETFPIAEYPVGSYFTYNGRACDSHEECRPEIPCNCRLYDNSIQCMGFAKYACDQYAHRSKWSYTPSHTDETLYKFSSGGELKDLINRLGLEKGAYIRLCNAKSDPCTGDHSVVLVDADSTHITVYEANYGGLCRVNYRSLTYEKFVSQYDRIYKTFAHSFHGAPKKYDEMYHKIPCELSGCTSYILQPHYAQIPGANATCLGCGYVGNISSGIMSVDEMME